VTTVTPDPTGRCVSYALAVCAVLVTEHLGAPILVRHVDSRRPWPPVELDAVQFVEMFVQRDGVQLVASRRGGVEPMAHAFVAYPLHEGVPDPAAVGSPRWKRDLETHLAGLLAMIRTPGTADARAWP
jgi:hypothetical protein